MRTVHTKDRREKIRQQRGGGTEEHDEHHVEVADDGLGLVERGQIDIGTFGVVLIPDEEGDQHRRQDDVDAYFGRGHPVEHLAVVEHIHQHEQSGRDEHHLTHVQLAERHRAVGPVVAEADRHEEDGHQNEGHHEVVHVLPVIVVGQLRRDEDRKLSATVGQRIEIGVELAADVARAEDLLCMADKPQHEESLQEADHEAADDQDVGMLRCGTYPAQHELQHKVAENKGLAGEGVEYLRDDRVGDSHAGRGGIITHRDVLGIGAERIGDLEHAARVGAVEQDNRQDDRKDRHQPEPVGNPLADRKSELPYVGHRRRASVSTIMPARNRAISSRETPSSSIRTGMRCWTFTKLPAELSVGTSEYFDPVASEMADTRPRKTRPGRASTFTRTSCPMKMWMICVSL